MSEDTKLTLGVIGIFLTAVTLVTAYIFLSIWFWNWFANAFHILGIGADVTALIPF